jgi:hypothetical protein
MTNIHLKQIGLYHGKIQMYGKFENIFDIIYKLKL